MTMSDHTDSRPRWARGLSAEQWRWVCAASWNGDHHWVAMKLGYVQTGPAVDYSQTAAPDFGPDWLAEDVEMEEARVTALEIEGNND